MLATFMQPPLSLWPRRRNKAKKAFQKIAQTTSKKGLPGLAAAIAEQIFEVEQPTSRLIFSGNLIVVS